MGSDGEHPPDPDRSELMARLARAAREHRISASAWNRAVATRLGLGPSDEKVLQLLDRFGPLTAGDLVFHTGLAPASVTGVIDRLERRDFVRRTPHPSDRRRVVVEVGDALVAAFAPLAESMAATFDELFGGYDDDELALVLDFLQEADARQRDEVADLLGEEADLAAADPRRARR